MYPVVKIDGETLVDLKAGGYAYTYLAPGLHEIVLCDSAILSPDAKIPYFKEEFFVSGGQQLFLNGLSLEIRFTHTISIGLISPHLLTQT